MKAWQYENAVAGLEKSMTLSTDVAPPPQASLKKNEFLVEVLSMSINPVDYKVPEVGRLAKLMVKVPASPGLDFAGKVAAKHPEDDTGLSVGQMVFGRLDGLTQFGTLAQFIVASSAGCIPIPDGVSVDDAAALGTAALTAYQTIVPFVKKDPTKATVFINGGSGGVGTYGIQIAKAIGAHVITSCSTANAALCKELGADEVIDYRKDDVAAVLKAKGQTLDLVVDNVGTPGNLYKESEHFLKPTCSFVQIAGSPSLGSIAGMMDKKFRPTFLGGGKSTYVSYLTKNSAEEFKQLGAWLAAGKIKAVIADRFEYEDAPKAFEKLKTGRTVGKIVVHVSDSKQ